MSRPDYTQCRQTDACLCPACYDRKHGAPPAEVAELADRMADNPFGAALTAGIEHAREHAPSGADVCDRCGYPVVLTPAGWAHDQAGDAVACTLFYEGDKDIANGR